MAERRVQVERLRPSARLQAVARPVETYVRPADQPVGESDLSSFISAIAPATEQLAKVEREKQLKLQREAEKGITSARAFDAQLGAGKALRAAFADYADPANTEAYLNMTPEQVRDKRAEIMQPFLDKVQQSGDDKLALAFQQDIELGNLDFFAKSYDPLKREFDLNNSLDEVFTEVLAIQDNPMLSDDLKDTATDNLLRTYNKTTGTPWNAINKYAIATTANRVSQDGRTSLYRWLDKEGQLGVSKYQDTVRTINTRLASYDSAQLKVGKDEFFAASVRGQIASFLQSGDVMSVGGEVQFKDGTTQSVSDEDIIMGMQSIATQLGLKEDEALKQLYRPFNIVPTEDANAIMSGKSLLSFGDLTEDNLLLMANAYTAYKKVDGYEFTIKDNLMNGDEKKLMKAMDYLIEKKGVGPEGPAIGVVREALEMVRTIDLKSPVRKASSADITALLDTGMLDLSDFDEVKNGNDMIPYIQEGVDLYMQMGASLEAATEQAVKDARNDFLVIEGSNGTKHALPILNTAIDRTGNEVAMLQSYIEEAILVPKTGQAVSARGGTGVVLRRSMNPKMLNISVIDDNGLVVGSLGEIPLATAVDPATAKSMIAARIQRTANDDQYVSGVMGVVIEPIEKFDTEATIASETPTIESKEALVGTLVTELPESFNIRTAREIVEDGQFTGQYFYEGFLSDGSPVSYKSYQKPEAALPPEAKQTVPEAPAYQDAIMRLPEPPAVKEAVQDAVKEMNEVYGTSFEDVREYNQSQIDNLKSRVLRTKAIKDMQGTKQEKVSIVDRIMGSLFGEPAQAGRSDVAGDVTNIQGTSMTNKATNLIKSQEGFDPNPYPDGKDRSVGYGFYLPSLEDDELALINDVENITQEEADAVLNLKISKIEDYAGQQLPAINTLSEEAQAAVVSMMFQLGKENVVRKFPTFFKNLKAATEAPANSQERAEFLKVASANMVYNFKNGKQVSETLWNQQTPKRAQAMAALVAEG